MEQAGSCAALMQVVALPAAEFSGCCGVLLQAGKEQPEFFSIPGRPCRYAVQGPLPGFESVGARLVVGKLLASPQLVDGADEAPITVMAASVRLGETTDSPIMHFIWDAAIRLEQEVLDVLNVLSSVAAMVLGRQRDAERAREIIERSRQEHLSSQHRFRNILSFVRSIVRRTMQSAESPEEFALHLEGRISALARTQSALNLPGVNGVEIEDLVRAELRANAIDDEQVDIEGPSLRLRERSAEAMALALHELAINSLKYGALSGHGGRTRIHWQTDSDSQEIRLKFSWREVGVRVAVEAPRHRGFGQELIENTLPYELDALTRFELKPGGLHCTVDMPVNARISSHYS